MGRLTIQYLKRITQKCTFSSRSIHSRIDSLLAWGERISEEEVCKLSRRAVTR